MWWSLHELEALEILLGPSGLIGDYAFERLNVERITRVMKGDRDAATVRMEIVLMGTRLPIENKPVSDECSNK